MRGTIRVGALVAAAGLALASIPGVAAGATGQESAGEATSVIFYMGDGMGQVHRDAAQMVTVGAYGRLAMDSLPYAGLVGTNSVDPDGPITDSAAGATSYAAGVETVNGAVGVDADGENVTLIAELAKAEGKSIGVVSTSQVTDASGAAFAAHVPDRGDQSEIARQLIEEAEVDVILGGGEDRWLPEGEEGAFPDNPDEDPEEQSEGDQGNLIERAEELDYEYVSDAEGLEAATGPKLLGLFANEEMFQQNPEGEGDIYDPVVSLEAMTAKAIEILSQDEDGFFLFVEEEAIDEMSHRNNAELTLRGVEELDAAVATGVAYAEEAGDTLLMVTADHECGGLAIEGLSNAEFPDESGAGGTYEGATDGAEGDLISGADGPFAVADSGYEIVLDWSTTGHTAVDVPLTAMGPGAENLTGNFENTRVFEVMVEAMGLDLPEGIPAEPEPGATPEA